MTSPVALVTGGSSGIGESTARALLAKGFVVHAVARRVDRMATLSDLGVQTHLMDVTDDATADELAERVDATLETYAPGFASRVVARHVQRPGDLQRADANLHGGAVNGGTAQLFQQLIFRPVPGLGRPETVVRGLYLGSASAHPGGGVHGVCGWLAARAALADQKALGVLRRRVRSGAHELIYRA